MNRKPHIPSYLVTRAGYKFQLQINLINIVRLTTLKVTEASLLAKNEDTAGPSICKDRKSAKIPDEGITQKINLLVLLDPEILCRI